MNHLTNHYKHKCEQLQEQINNIKKFLNEVQTPDGGLQNDFERFGPRSPGSSIPVGEPGSRDHGPPKHNDYPPPAQPLPGASETEWNNWLNRMWQWYISKYPYTLTDGNGDSIQQWWRVWHDIHELAPNYPFGWDWSDQPQYPGGPPRPKPLQEKLSILIRMLNEADASANPMASANPVPQNAPGYDQPFQRPDGQWQSPVQNPTNPSPRGIKPPECQCPIGSQQWREWIRYPGNWHYSNPHPFGTDIWEEYERQNAT